MCLKLFVFNDFLISLANIINNKIKHRAVIQGNYFQVTYEFCGASQKIKLQKCSNRRTKYQRYIRK